MPEGTSHSLVDLNLGALAKPADTLIKKISEAVGGAFAPYQIERIARAEAKAAVINAENEIKITNLHRRAMYRFIQEEAKHQQNIEQITTKSFPQLKETSDPSKMEDDWIANFLNKARIISNEEMQQLWSRVLAGEANSPGTYSKRTVNLLADLDKPDAELFTKLCGFCWHIGNLIPLIFEFQADIYNAHGIDFNAVHNLETAGLVHLESVTGVSLSQLPKKVTVYYYGQSLTLEMPNDAGNLLNVGKIVLSTAGQQLAPICQSKPVDGFRDYVIKHWQNSLPGPKIVSS